MNHVSFCSCVVASSLAFLSLGGCATTTPQPLDAPRGRLRVTDGKLLDAEGKRAVLKGLGLGALEAVRGVGHWNEEYFTNAKAWGAEVVRLPVDPSTFRNERKRTLADLDDAVRWCHAHELYLIIDYHVIGNIPQSLFHYEESTATTWPELRDFWATVAARYADTPTVAFLEIYNEPAVLEYLGGTWTFAEWRQSADEIVSLVRAHAPLSIPLVGGFNFASDYSAGGEKPFESPDIALTAHPYPGLARTNRRAAWDAAFGHLSDRYPFVFTEVGFDPYDEIVPRSYRDDLPYGRELLSYAEEKHISWAAFVFYSGPGWPMQLFSDWETLKPTVSGLFFKDLLAGKSIATAGDGFGERPPVVDPKGNGPSNLIWNHWAEAGATSEWLEAPSSSSVAVRVTAGAGTSGGMAADLHWDGVEQDLGGFNQLVFDGTVAVGSACSVAIGRTVAGTYYGCTWGIVGKGQGTYTVDLTKPSWCGPTACFDLKAQNIAFNNQWSQESSTVDIRIERVELQVDAARPLPAQGQVGTGPCE